MPEKYTPKKVLYNPTIGSILLLIIIVGFIFLTLKNDNILNLIIQSAQKVTQLMSK
jgi:hypothetical protein